MKAITLTQPWATLVAIGAKRIETRSWSTAYRGPLAIHAAHGLGPHKRYSVFRELCESEPFRSVLAAAGYTRASHLPTGAVLVVVDVVDVQPTAGPRGEQGTGPKYADWVHGISSQEYAFGDYTPGRYGWFLQNVRRIGASIPARGQLGLWEVDIPGVEV